MSNISVNTLAIKLVKEMCKKAKEYQVKVKRSREGATIIDAGIEQKGGFLAGKALTEICLGGLGTVKLSSMDLGSLKLPSISVFTDHPATATLGSQLAGWRIKTGKYFAVGSGPARALARKPKFVFEQINYHDESDTGVLVLETSKAPPREAIDYVASECGIEKKNLFLIVAATSSVAGSTQISGRTAETGIHKLTKLGFDPKLITQAWSCTPILPVHSDFAKAMGRTNDAIQYGGSAYYNVIVDDDEKLKCLVEKSVSSASKQYGRPFSEIFEEADRDFYKIDPSLFAPAQMTVCNTKTGKVFTAGRINCKVLLASIGLTTK